MRLLALMIAMMGLPSSALGFCGFFVSGADAELHNNASQVALMRKGNKTVLSMSNNYQGPPEDFAMVVPVPVVLQKEQVKTLPHDVFSKVDQLSAPRLVEYWEQDPCQRPYPRRRGMVKLSAAPQSVPMPVAAAPKDFGVTIEAQFEVGEYQIVILSAKEANGLEGWLKANEYTIPDGASKALAPYIRGGMKFFVAKVNIEKVKRDDHGYAVLSPLRFDYESEQFSLPVRLGLLNANGKQDLIVYVLHPTSRFEVANYPNVFIPSNVEVLDKVRENFGAFYAQLFDSTMAAHGNKAVITEYAWQTNGCDPCPVPPLQPSDLMTLGGDVMGVVDNSGGKTAPGRRPMPGRPFFGPASSWVLTRMHTRYSKDTLSEDLVFTEAKPVVGGRARGNGTGVEAPGAVEMSSTNNFQGRYIIRHFWEGKVACENPIYNRWGGPPSNPKGKKKAAAATDLANAPRGEVELNKVVRSNLPQLKIDGMPAPKR
ncbi:MAG: DUF2330 domain-containing protein [Bradymonadia bacterium]